VAIDAGGIPACKPLYEAAKARYVTLVDADNALSDAFGFKVIPNGYLIDEAGVLRFKRVGGFEVSSPATVKAVEDFLALPKAAGAATQPAEPTLEELAASFRQGGHPESALALGKMLLRAGRTAEAHPILNEAAAGLPKSSSAQFALGTCLLALGKKPEAVSQLRKALSLDRENFVVRKQIWLIEHPERFHPTIDWAWQREQLKKEREAERDGDG